MIPNIHQSIEEIIKAANPAQKIIWQQIRLLSGEIASVRQVHFQGPVIPFCNSYILNRLFIANHLFVTNAGMGAAAAYLMLYDENNALFGYSQNNSIAWDTTGAAMKYYPNDIHLQDIYFSKLALSGYAYIVFNGYIING